MGNLIRAENLKKTYQIRKFLQRPRFLKALDGVSFSLGKQKTLGVVGESGCGKSTLAKLILQIEKPNEGEIFFKSHPFAKIKPSLFRSKLQMIFQDPYSSINPRKQAGEIIGEPLKINFGLNAAERKNKVIETMERVGLRPEYYGRYPHMFSGGQRQRIGIARALVMRPEVVICDEPVSALDISIQAQVINLLVELQKEYQLSYLFISHDLSVVRHIAHDVMVMYLGRIVEMGSRDQIFNDPKHPYTQALLASTPKVRKKDRRDPVILEGEIPSPLTPPAGCSFHTRCPVARADCRVQTPELLHVQERQVACHRVV